MADFADFVRIYPALFFTTIACFYTGRILLLRRRLGRSPVTLGDPGSVARRISRRFRMFRAIIWAAMVGRAVSVEFDRWLLPLQPLATLPMMLSGAVLMTLSFGAIVSLHRWMGPTWRSGIDPIHSEGLRTTGAFRYLRHPMFTLVMLGQLGLFLAAPSLFTAICLVVGARTLLAQARLEEAWLARTYGARWELWAAGTPAWPWDYLTRHRHPLAGFDRS